MKVIVDGIIYSLQRHGGITVYFNELLSRLVQTKEDTELFTFNPLLPVVASLAGGKLKNVKPRIFERYRPCDLTVAGSTGAVFHSSYYRLPSVKSIATVVTVHDFIYERIARGARRWVHSSQKFAAIRAAQAVICVSQSTLNDLHEFVGVRQNQSVHIIHNGASDIFKPLLDVAVLKPFVLFVGQRGGYKNFRALLRCLPLLPGLEVRCVGGGWFTSNEFVGVDETVRNRIHHVGFVTDYQLNTLYNRALCLVYPSSYEGFGIPVVEAMKAGCPVVSFDCAAIREIGGSALVVADSLEPADMRDAILQSVDNFQRPRLIKQGLCVSVNFSWDVTHSKTLAVYKNVAQ